MKDEELVIGTRFCHVEVKLHIEELPIPMCSFLQKHI